MAQVEASPTSAGPTGTSTSTGPTPSGPEAWAVDLLEAIGAPVNETNVTLVEAWQQEEGQWTAGGVFNAANMYNPLNIESTAPGSPQGTQICSGGACTLQFQSWQDGLTATADFLNTYQSGIVSALKNSDASSFLQAVGGWDPGNSSYSSDIGSNYNSLLNGSSGWLGDVANAIKQYGASVATLGAVGIVGETVGASYTEDLSKLLGELVSTGFWKRVGMGVLGAAMLVIGLWLVLDSTKAGEKVEQGTSQAASVAALAAA